MEIKSGINGIVALAEQANAKSDGDYVDADGLLHCGICHEAKQYREDNWLGSGESRLLPVSCACKREERRRFEEHMKQEERRRRLEGMRRAGFPDAEMRKWTFKADDGKSGKAMQVARRYADNFPTMLENGKGLLLYGNVGSGKSFIAACIANSLIDQGTPALMTNFSRIVNQLQETFDGRQRYLDRLNGFDLLVIDDLAAERDTDYMWEQVMNVIDSRYRAGLPVVVTTNLGLEDLTDPADIRRERVYSRLVEMCIPVRVSGQDRRGAKAAASMSELRGLLGL